MDGADPVENDETTGTTRHVFGVRPDDSHTLAIVTGVAEVLDCDPLNLPELLYDSVDVDALNALFTLDGRLTDAPFVSFEYCGYTVGVEPRRIVVSSQE